MFLFHLCRILHSGTIFFCFVFVCVYVRVRVCEAAMCRAKNKSNKQKRNNFAELLYLLLPQQLLIDS